MIILVLDILSKSLYTFLMNTSIDRRIKNRFQIYAGVRSREEDDALYYRIYAEVYKEILRFIEEQLDKKTLETIRKEIEKIDIIKGEPLLTFKKTYSIILRNLPEEKEFRYRLDRRVDHFINNLLITTIKRR